MAMLYNVVSTLALLIIVVKMCVKRLVYIILTLFIGITSGLFYTPTTYDTGIAAVKKAPRVNMPWLGIGMWCNGCPPVSCEDDGAIIHGYCCGCAQELDHLPVTCPKILLCPLNLHGVCHDYEYMMRCCC